MDAKKLEVQKLQQAQNAAAAAAQLQATQDKLLARAPKPWENKVLHERTKEARTQIQTQLKELRNSEEELQDDTEDAREATQEDMENLVHGRFEIPTVIPPAVKKPPTHSAKTTGAKRRK